MGEVGEHRAAENGTPLLPVGLQAVWQVGMGPVAARFELWIQSVSDVATQALVKPDAEKTDYA